VTHFSVGEGLRRAVKNRLRSTNKGSEADLDWRAQELAGSMRPYVNDHAIAAEMYLSRRIEMDSILKRQLSAQRRRDSSLRQLEQRRSRQQRVAAQIARALIDERNREEFAAPKMATVARKRHADLRIRRAVQLCRKLLRMAIRGVGEIWLVGSRCLTPAGKQRPARGSRASATLLDHQDAHTVGQQGVDALRNGNELPTTDVLPRLQARSSSYCAAGGIWPMFAQRADFPDRAGAFGVRSPSYGGSAADIRA
jgi:hypothetical protein